MNINHDDLEIIKDLIVIFGFPLTVLGAFLAASQYRRNVAWNKLNATFSLFGNKQYSEFHSNASQELSRLGIDLNSLNEALPLLECEKIINDQLAYKSVKALLNYFEDYSTALHSGVIHRKLAFNLMGDTLIRHHRIFSLLITSRRQKLKNDTLWSEFELASSVFEQEYKELQRNSLSEKLKNIRNKKVY